MFFEDYQDQTGRGVIACSEVHSDGSVQRAFKVLERPFHLSYPYVFEHDGRMLMVPESADNRTVDLYVATGFPRVWEPLRSLVRDVNGADATVYFDGSLWWMFLCVGEFGAAPWDELFLYYAQNPEGPWEAHPQSGKARCGHREAGWPTLQPTGKTDSTHTRLLVPLWHRGEPVRNCRVNTTFLCRASR